MSTTPDGPTLPAPPPHRARKAMATLGASALAVLHYVGGIGLLLAHTLRWVWRSCAHSRVHIGRPALYAQIVRLGVRSIAVVSLVCACIGLILALQIAPPLEPYGVEQIAHLIALTIFRELGPLVAAIVMTGFAGASIAAELGTMVVGEEVEALQAMGLNPVRFLVVPRVMATLLAMLVLTVIGELVAIAAGWAVGVGMLDIPSSVYIHNTLDQLDLADVLTGLWKAGVFGLILSSIACYNGLSVTGGAAGVGKATTYTVVHSIVSIIIADMVFTIVFYRLGWN